MMSRDTSKEAENTVRLVSVANYDVEELCRCTAFVSESEF